MKAYKGFNKDLTCRGFQFEVGKEYKEENASLCKSGFHACERPLDVFRYYLPANSVYHRVELDDVSDERESGDTKLCARKIHIGTRLSIGELVKAQIEYTKEHCNTKHTDPERATAGDYGAATAGNSGAATAGYSGAATAGDYGAATAGNSGAATAGYSGAATAGYRGAATAGYSGAATAGNSGAATSRGKSAVGENGIAVARGNGVMAKGSMGAIIVIAEEKDDCYDLIGWKAGVIDGKILKPDIWYKLIDGEFVEAEP